MPEIAIVNQSSIVSDRDGQTITSALNLILPKFCNDWGLSSYTCIYVPPETTTIISLKILLMDSIDQAPTDEYIDVPCEKVAVNGVLLYNHDPSVPTFAQTLSHRLFEMLINPLYNLWAMSGDNCTQYAYEVCDPVESNTVTVHVETGSTFIKTSPSVGFKLSAVTAVPIYTQVSLSDWVLPKWFDSRATMGPFNHTDTLSAPFTVDKNGYAITLKKGKARIIWDEAVTIERRILIEKNPRRT